MFFLRTQKNKNISKLTRVQRTSKNKKTLLTKTETSSDAHQNVLPAMQRDNVKCVVWDSVLMLVESVFSVMDASHATPINLPFVPVVSSPRYSTRPPKLVRLQHAKTQFVLIATQVVNALIATMVTLRSKATASSVKTAATHAKSAVRALATRKPNCASKVSSTSPPHQRASSTVAYNAPPGVWVARPRT